MRIAVVGKGGAGKSVIAGTIARLLAQRSKRVLALDSDLVPGLALSLGADPPPVPPLLEAAEQDGDGRWRLKKGIGPVRAVQRYSTAAPDGIRLLQAGKAPPEGVAAIRGSLTAFYEVVHRLRHPGSLRDWAMIGDLPAGPRQTAYDWAPYADTFLLVVEPSWKSVLTARRIARIARSRGAARVLPVANKVQGAADARAVARGLGEGVAAAIPADEQVVEAERRGLALIDAAPSSRAVSAIASMLEELDRRASRA